VVWRGAVVFAAAVGGACGRSSRRHGGSHISCCGRRCLRQVQLPPWRLPHFLLRSAVLAAGPVAAMAAPTFLDAVGGACGRSSRRHGGCHISCCGRRCLRQVESPPWRLPQVLLQLAVLAAGPVAAMAAPTFLDAVGGACGRSSRRHGGSHRSCCGRRCLRQVQFPPWRLPHFSIRSAVLAAGPFAAMAALMLVSAPPDLPRQRYWRCGSSYSCDCGISAPSRSRSALNSSRDAAGGLPRSRSSIARRIRVRSCWRSAVG